MNFRLSIATQYLYFVISCLHRIFRWRGAAAQIRAKKVEHLSHEIIKLVLFFKIK